MQQKKKPYNGHCNEALARVGSRANLHKTGRPTMSKPVRVAVGILQREDGQILLASRPTDKPWPHWWELPGGKIEPTETPLAAVERELYEELGIRIEPQRATHWHTLTHHYPRGTVILELFIITGWAYTPQPLEEIGRASCRERVAVWVYA